MDLATNTGVAPPGAVATEDWRAETLPVSMGRRTTSRVAKETSGGR